MARYDQVLRLGKGKLRPGIQIKTIGQSNKSSTIVIYEARVVNISNLLVITTAES